MSNFKTAIIEIAGTNYSKTVMYTTQVNLLQQVEDFVFACGFGLGYNTQVNEYDPEYSLEVCVNKFYI